MRRTRIINPDTIGDQLLLLIQSCRRIAARCRLCSREHHSPTRVRYHNLAVSALTHGVIVPDRTDRLGLFVDVRWSALQ